MKLTTIAIAAALALSPCMVLAQKPSGMPVDIRVSGRPAPLMAGGQNWLLYELRLTSYHVNTITLSKLVILDEERKPLASFSDSALEPLLAPIGPATENQPMRAIAPGQTISLFVDLALAAARAVPTALSNNLSLSTTARSGAPLDDTIAVAAPVNPAEPVVILPPLRGSNWLAVNGLADPGHRRVWVAIDGVARIPERFAIDWVRLGPDGKAFAGDAGRNESFAGYGATVHAVADGRVITTIDGVPNNDGVNAAAGRTITLDTIAGNAVVQDIGGGRFALYAHLQPGSLQVKPGDSVRAGQVLGRLGNSGNSDAPHLHFQLMDHPSPLKAEGLPYRIAHFTQVGVVADLDIMMNNGWQPDGGRVTQRNAFPLDNAVVAFPD